MSFASHIRETGDENSIHIDAEVFRHPVEHDVCKVDVIGGGVGGCLAAAGGGVGIPSAREVTEAAVRLVVHRINGTRRAARIERIIVVPPNAVVHLGFRVVPFGITSAPVPVHDRRALLGEWH